MEQTWGQFSNTEIVRRLIEAGLDMNVALYDGYTPLSMASKNSNTDGNFKKSYGGEEYGKCISFQWHTNDFSVSMFETSL